MTVDYSDDDGTVLNTCVNQHSNVSTDTVKFPALCCLRHFNIHFQFLASWGCFWGRDENPFPPDRIFSHRQRLGSSCETLLPSSLSVDNTEWATKKYRMGHEKVARLPFCTCPCYCISVFTLCYGTSGLATKK
jgi:hypothetical protein